MLHHAVHGARVRGEEERAGGSSALVARGGEATCPSVGVAVWMRARVGSEVRGEDALAAVSPARRSTEKLGMSTTMACRGMGEDGVVLVSEAREPFGHASSIVQGHRRGR
jgi:hypothetical protein